MQKGIEIEMSRKTVLSRIAAVTAFVVWISIVLSLTGKIVRAKFIGDSTTIVNGFYEEKEKRD